MDNAIPICDQDGKLQDVHLPSHLKKANLDDINPVALFERELWPNMLTRAQSTLETMPPDLQSNGCTSVLDPTWSVEGTYSLKMTANGTDTFVRVGGDLGGLRLGMRPGRKYRVTATYRITETITSATTGNGQLALTLWHTRNGSHTKKIPMVSAKNAPGVYVLDDEFTVPVDATAAWVRFYLGYLAPAQVWIDRLGLFDITDATPPPGWWLPGRA